MIETVDPVADLQSALDRSVYKVQTLEQRVRAVEETADFLRRRVEFLEEKTPNLLPTGFRLAGDGPTSGLHTTGYVPDQTLVPVGWTFTAPGIVRKIT